MEVAHFQFRGLKRSYDALTDKSGIEARQVEFPGFDGNRETDLMGFANLLGESGSFNDILNPKGNNAHMPTVDVYRRMLSCLHDMGGVDYPYSKEQIQQLLDARKYKE